MWHGYAVTSTLLADPPSNETIDVFYIKTGFKNPKSYKIEGEIKREIYDHVAQVASLTVFMYNGC